MQTNEFGYLVCGAKRLFYSDVRGLFERVKEVRKKFDS
jgi:hypothetical protein